METLLDRFLKTIPDELKTNNTASWKVCTQICPWYVVELQTDYQRMNRYTKQGLIPPTSLSIGVRQGKEWITLTDFRCEELN